MQVDLLGVDGRLAGLFEDVAIKRGSMKIYYLKKQFPGIFCRATFAKQAFLAAPGLRAPE